MIEKLVTDTIFEAIRQELVIEGYLPDITQIPNYNSQVPSEIIEANSVFKNQMQSIENSKGFCIELLGFSNSEYKGNKKVARIVIDNHQMMPNELGNDTSVFYEKITVGDKQLYRRKRSVSLLSDLTFTVYCVGASAKQMMTMNMIVAQALPYRGYIKPLGETDFLPYNNFFVNLIDKGKQADLVEGVIERYFIYKCTDLKEIPDQVINGYVEPIREIKLDPYYPN